MARYLVTGGCGFIGSHLVDRLLADGHAVRVLDDLSSGHRANLDARAELVVADAADRDAVGAAASGVDGCFHLAAIASVTRSVTDWPGTHRANQSATVAVLDAARTARGGAPAPVVYASSAAVYGDNPALPLTEDATTVPLSAYGADKLGSELHARVGAHVHGVATTGGRFFNVYGPRQDPASPYSGVISIFAERILAGRGITMFGDGGQSRDFVYVGDVVGFLCRAMAAAAAAAAATVPGRASVYNVCTGRSITVAELAGIIAGLADRVADISRADPRQGDIRHSCGDPALAAAELGFHAATDVADGLAATIGWMRERG